MSTHAKEYLWVLIVSILILALSSVPIVAGYAAQTPDQRFIGTFADNQDYAVHLAMIHYGQQGHWDYQFRFTTEPQATTYLKTIYVVIGHITAFTGLPADIIFQVIRLIFGLLACLSIYYLLTRIFADVEHRRLAFVLAILGAGLGWLQVAFGWIPEHNLLPIDLWLIDAYVFFDIATLPHLSIAIAVMAYAVAVFLNHLHRPHWVNIVILSACAIFVQFISPIAFGIADLAFAGAFVFFCWQKHKIDWPVAFTLVFLFIIQVPLALYSLVLLTRDPAWAVFNDQNITLSPPPIYLLLGFALFWPFAFVGAKMAIRQRNENLGWALIWVVAALVLAYLPLAIQRRFLLAITVPLAVLATPAIMDFSSWLHRRWKFSKLSAAIMVTALTILTPLVMIFAFSTDMARKPASLFEPAALIQATEWLNENGQSDQVVLAAEATAQLVGMRTPLRLYFGHPMETLYYAEKSQAVERFYRGEQPANWLKSAGINWVIFGPHEKLWGNSPPNLPNLKIAYQNKQVTIFQVIDP